MGEDEAKKAEKVGPRQWAQTEELLRPLRDLPPDPTLMEDIRELGGTLEDLGDPWEETRRRRSS
jgi:hypothetical protein